LQYLQVLEYIAKHLKEIMQEGDIILTIGAGDVTHISEML
jgi:UDP-N-acetylmuramate-alanine ligase